MDGQDLSDPGELFRATFQPQHREALVAALQRGYRTAAEQHDPEHGSNEQTFGFGLYHFNVFELRSTATSNAALGFDEVTVNQAFRLRLDAYTLACHRVGHYANENIWSSFPDNSGAAHALVAQQGWLPGMEPRVDTARNLVLAHFGNPEDGLDAVYLCIPTREKDERITEWGFADLLWHRGGDDPTRHGLPGPTLLTPAETIETPLVRRKRRERGA